MPGALQIDYASLGERDLVACAQRGERDAFRAIMKRGNQRLFRVARAIVGDDSGAEDVVQDAYLRAFAHLDSFRGEASVLTWLTRITINEANQHVRRRRPVVGLEAIEAEQASGGDVIMFPNSDAALTPEADAARAQVRRIIEAAIDDLPEAFRLVFILRDIEDCSAAEAADSLGVREETVKTRLHRARRLLRTALHQKMVSTVGEAFPFLGRRCERITETVLSRL
jgi:RNA polymerase sigma-70 factor (ECF subfamily)